MKHYAQKLNCLLGTLKTKGFYPMMDAYGSYLKYPTNTNHLIFNNGKVKIYYDTKTNKYVSTR